LRRPIIPLLIFTLIARFIITSIFIPVIVTLTLLFRELINLDFI